MSSGIQPSERPWRCPRCKCPRGYVTCERSLSSSIQFEIVICENCACVEHRAADLQSVAALAAGGLRGVRHVDFPQETGPFRWNSLSNAPPGMPQSAQGSPSPVQTAVSPGSVGPLDQPIRIPPPPPPPRRIVPWTSVPQPVSERVPTGLVLAGGCVRAAPILAIGAGVVIAALALIGSWRAPGSAAASAPLAQATPAQKDLEPLDSTPFVCPARSEITLVDRTIHVDRGAAITVEPQCKLKLVRCDIKGPTAIQINNSSEPELTFQNSRIEGTVLAFEPSFTTRVDASNSLIIGPVPMKWARRALLHGITSVSLADIPGAPHAVDPAALVEIARRVSGLGERSVLAQIDGIFVGSNGRVDLDAPAYKGQVHYRFELAQHPPGQRELLAGVPVGAAIFLVNPGRRQRRTVTVDIDGIVVDDASSDGVVLGPSDTPLHCSFQQAWDAARTGDVPADALAHIMYNSDSGGQAWWFHVDDTQFTFSINAATCKR